MNNFTEKNNMIVPPCKDCTDRHYACHDVCAGYKHYKLKLKEFAETKRRVEQKEFNYHIAANKKNKNGNFAT